MSAQSADFVDRVVMCLVCSCCGTLPRALVDEFVRQTFAFATTTKCQPRPDCTEVACISSTLWELTLAKV